MDMKQFIRPYLTLAELEKRGGEFEGVIASVTDTYVRNPFTTERTREPMIQFQDGTRLVLNKTALKQCIGWFGAESENWIGRRLRVFVQSVERVNRTTGEVTVKRVRALLCEDPHVLAAVRRRQDAAVDRSIAAMVDEIVEPGGTPEVSGSVRRVSEDTASECPAALREPDTRTLTHSHRVSGREKVRL